VAYVEDESWVLPKGRKSRLDFLAILQSPFEPFQLIEEPIQLFVPAGPPPAVSGNRTINKGIKYFPRSRGRLQLGAAGSPFHHEPKEAI